MKCTRLTPDKTAFICDRCSTIETELDTYYEEQGYSVVMQDCGGHDKDEFKRGLKAAKEKCGDPTNLIQQWIDRNP